MHVVHTAGSCIHASDIHPGGFVRGVKSSVQTTHVVGGFADRGNGGSSSMMSSRHDGPSSATKFDENVVPLFSLIALSTVRTTTER